MTRFSDAFVLDAMAGLGYKRVKRYVYRASWSTCDVEHFIYFYTWGTPKHFVSVNFALRNPGAEQFGERIIRRYGGSVYQLMRHDPSTHCFMSFSLEMLAGWEPRSSIYLPDSSATHIARTVTESVRGRVFPLVHDVTTTEPLLKFLLSDVRPFGWVHSNGAVRATQVAYLSKQLGESLENIRRCLQPFAKQLRPDLQHRDPDLFIEQVLKEVSTRDLDCPRTG
jgi:hypothetical protein